MLFNEDISHMLSNKGLIQDIISNKLSKLKVNINKAPGVDGIVPR